MSMTYAYHATTPENLASILKEGLQPQLQQHPDEDRCTPLPAIFFCPTADWAAQWGPVIVRFPWPADAAEDSYGDTMLVGGLAIRTNWLTLQPVNPSNIELTEGQPGRR